VRLYDRNIGGIDLARDDSFLRLPKRDANAAGGTVVAEAARQ
jgi:hypothetical protein